MQNNNVVCKCSEDSARGYWHTGRQTRADFNVPTQLQKRLILLTLSELNWEKWAVQSKIQTRGIDPGPQNTF